MVTNAKSWKKKDTKNHELEVPSGNTCLVKRPGPEIFAQQGMIPNSLMEIVMPLLDDAKAKGAAGDGSPLPEADLADLQKQLINDPAKFADMITMIDSITVNCVLSPLVSPAELRAEIWGDPSLTDEQRQEKCDELLFVDEVDFEDKMFIFAFAVGGSADIERFRIGTESLVAAGQTGPEVPHTPE